MDNISLSLTLLYLIAMAGFAFSFIGAAKNSEVFVDIGAFFMGMFFLMNGLYSLDLTLFQEYMGAFGIFLGGITAGMSLYKLSRGVRDRTGSMRKQETTS